MQRGVRGIIPRNVRIVSPPFSQPGYRLAFVGLSVALLALMLAVAPRFGATWDEPQQRGKALRLLAYLSGRTATLNEPIDGAHLYGAPFDIVAAALEPVVPADPYVIRHEVIAVVGWTCILLTGLLADRIFGPPHGLLAMALLAASPPFFAHAMNNPKDLPFAAVSTAVLLIFWTMGSRPPWASPRALVLLALVIGLGLNVRAGALLFIGYLAAVCGYWLLRGPLTLRDLLKAAASVASVLAIAVAIGWVGWPWAYQHPIRAPFMAMSELGHFAWPRQCALRRRVLCRLVAAWRLRAAMAVADAVARGARRPCPFVTGTGTRRDPRRRRAAMGRRAISDPLCDRHPRQPVRRRPPPPVHLSAAVHHLGVRLGRRVEKRGALETRRRADCHARPAGASGVPGQESPEPEQRTFSRWPAARPTPSPGTISDYWGNCLLEALATVDRSTPGDRVYVSGWPLLVLQADLTRFPRLVLVEPGDPRATRFVTLARGSRAELLALAAFPGIESRISTADGALLCTVSGVAPPPMTPTLPH